MKNLIRAIYQAVIKPVLLRIREGITPTPKEKVINLCVQFASQCNLEGDYWEFGVFRGDSFIAAYKFAQNLPRLKEMRFVAFDSFEGLPELTKEDSNIHVFKKAEYRYGLEEFKIRLNINGINLNSVDLIPGWFDKSLTKETYKEHSLRFPAVAMIDCDLYSSTKSVLKFLTDYVLQGTVLIFDDWFTYRNSSKEGEIRAVNEWLSENPQITLTEYYKYSYHGISFIVNIEDN
ncbi:MAG: hypothetical protein IIB94_13535 [Candidatus Marinimicrobia bacterium]|nr:hypothetical protein [Candidatus Neomarinimicrobiota bacterium]